jgi:hypothetical protein
MIQKIIWTSQNRLIKLSKILIKLIQNKMNYMHHNGKDIVQANLHGKSLNFTQKW